MIKKLSVILFLLCLFTVTTTTQLVAQAIQYENLIIEKIDVSYMNLPAGSEVESNLVLSKIKTRQGDYFSQNEFDNDLKTLAQDFDRVEPRVETRNGKIFIALRVWPKPKIRSILWIGNEKMETRSLQNELNIRVGTIFDRLEFNKGFHKVKALFVKKGFFEAEVSYRVILDDCTNEVDIEVTVDEGRSGRIKNIIFHNFTCDEEEEILEQMITKEWSIFTSWLSNEGTYHEEAIQQDRFMILNYLQDEGYADAKVDIEIVEADSCDRIMIHITADKGEQYSIGKITFSGNCLFIDDVIEEMITVSEGDVYSPDDIRETINVLTRLYGSKGYIDAYVDYSPRLDKDRCAYSLHFTIEEGEQYRIGLIKVFGNCSTQSSVILHEVLFAPGEIFNMNRLKITEEKLINVGYFSNVNVYAVKSDADYGCEGNYRDVHIEVEETSTGQFGASLGYSNTEGLFGGINITEKNFNYKGIPYLWSRGYSAVRGAGEYAQINLTLGTKLCRYGLSWTKPFFMDTKWSVGFDVERSLDHSISEHYKVNATTFSTHAGYLINQFVRFGTHYRLTNSQTKATGNHHDEKSGTGNGALGDPTTLTNFNGATSTGDPNKPFFKEDADPVDYVDAKKKAFDNSIAEQMRNDGLVSAVGATISYDSRDNHIKPRSGIFSRLQMEFAGVGGEHSFVSFGYLNSVYFPLSKRGTLKYRADLKLLQPIWRSTENELPVNERFFLGGDDGVRGYRPYSIGPKFDDGSPKGGISLLQLSAEYSYNLFSRVDAFIFADAGSLSGHQWRVLHELRTSAGFGFRIKIFEGAPAVTVGLGYPLNPGNKSDIQHFFFYMGARF